MDKIQQAIILFLYLIAGVNGGKSVVKLNVPTLVRSGDSITLSCIYNFDNPLYAVKWFFNDQEFYRYVPNAVPTQYSYSVQGMRVDISKSDDHYVTLLDITSNLSGVYRCEVSEDYPSYYTARKEAKMEIVDVPDMEPIIVTDSRIPMNEILRANCTSGASNPPPNITWTLNGDELSNNITKLTIHNRNIHLDDKVMTQSFLQFQTTNDAFQDGWVRLRCFATIDGIYTATAEYNVAKYKPFILPITENGCGTLGLLGFETKKIRIFWLIAATMLLLKLRR